MACATAGACCSLQARLHQLEAARVTELEAHGLRVRDLQREADASSASVKELQLELARMRTDRCRLEADAANARRRIQQTQDALDTERAAHAKVLLEKEGVCQDKERRVTRLQEELVVCQRERQQLVEERIELRMTVDALRQDTASLRATGEERLQTIQTQAAEIGRLGAVSSAQDQEIAATKLRHHLQEQELASVRAALEEEQGQRRGLERALERALQTRNRVIRWRRSWIDALRRELARRELFMEWKGMLLGAVSSRNKQVAAENEAARRKLQGIGSALRAQCVAVRRDLMRGKALWQQQAVELESFRRQVTTAEFPKLLALAVCVRDRCEMVANDAQSGCVAVRDAYLSKKQRARAREDALLELLERQRHKVWRSRTFNRWKDWYLRSVVGETTHAAMVSQLSQSLPLPVDPAIYKDRGDGRPASETRSPESTVDLSQSSPTGEASIDGVKVAPQEAARKKLATVAAAVRTSATLDDASWQRWRRIASAGNAPPRKSRVLLHSPLPSPSRGNSSRVRTSDDAPRGTKRIERRPV